MERPSKLPSAAYSNLNPHQLALSAGDMKMDIAALPLPSLGMGMICVFIFVSLIRRILNWVWLTPKRLEKHLKEQGLQGNSYRLLFGDEREVRRLMKEVKARPIHIDDDITPRVQPYQYKTVKKYGKNSFIWMGPIPVVILMNPEHIKEIFNKMNDFPKVKRNPLIKYLFSGLADYEGEKWVKHKRIMNPAFHLEKLKLMVPAIYQSCDEMINKWNKLASDQKGTCELDIWPHLNSCTGDVISRTAFGSSYEAGKRIFELLFELKDHTVKLMHSFYIPGERFVPTKINQRIKEIEHEVHELIKGIVKIREDAKKKGQASRNDLLGLLLESNHNEMEQDGNNESHGMSLKEIVDECKLFYFAGQESVAILLNWTIVFLCRYPEWQTRARQEIIQVFGTKKPTYDELNRLKVLTMILNETLRLYPPSSWLTRAIPQETKLGNLTLPAKSEVWISLLMLQTDTELWGDDAKEFKPERFSEGVLKATKGRVSFLPFGWGPRICPGQHYAVLEAKMLMCLILRNFSFEFSPSYVHAPYLLINIAPQFGTKILIHTLAD